MIHIGPEHKVTLEIDSIHQLPVISGSVTPDSDPYGVRNWSASLRFPIDVAEVAIGVFMTQPLPISRVHLGDKSAPCYMRSLMPVVEKDKRRKPRWFDIQVIGRGPFKRGNTLRK